MKTIRNLLLSAAVALCGSVLPAGAQEDAGKTTADVPVVKLNNDVLMPRFGLGTFMQGSDEVCRQSCLTALKAGYRHINTAHAYDDERGVEQAVKESGVPRGEVWITSKIWPVCLPNFSSPFSAIAEAHISSPRAKSSSGQAMRARRFFTKLRMTASLISSLKFVVCGRPM